MAEAHAGQPAAGSRRRRLGKEREGRENLARYMLNF
jgi:hypothetical protein